MSITSGINAVAGPIARNLSLNPVIAGEAASFLGGAKQIFSAAEIAALKDASNRVQKLAPLVMA